MLHEKTNPLRKLSNNSKINHCKNQQGLLLHLKGGKYQY